jgi:hypothetical protein
MKIKNKLVYYLARAPITPRIVNTTTTHPAITFRTPTNGTTRAPLTRAKPTAKETITPDIQIAKATNISRTDFFAIIENLLSGI